MKLNKTTITKYLLTLLVSIIFISVLFSANVLADDNQDVMTSLYVFYQASINNNLDLYMQVQDPLFLKMLEEDGTNPRTFYKAIFDEVDITSFSIKDPQIILQEDQKSAIVYYELKGTYVLDGEEVKIDNDMVAFLWKYDSWKVRWTMTRTLYEDKIAVNLFSDLIVQEAVDEVDNITLQETFIQENIPFELEPVVFEDKEESSFFQKTINFFLILIAIVIIVGLGFLIFKNKKKIIKKEPHRKTNDLHEKTKKLHEKTKDLHKKTGRALVKTAKKTDKVVDKMFEIIVSSSELIVKYSKKSLLFIIKSINKLAEKKEKEQKEQIHAHKNPIKKE